MDKIPAILGRSILCRLGIKTQVHDTRYEFSLPPQESIASEIDHKQSYEVE